MAYPTTKPPGLHALLDCLNHETFAAVGLDGAGRRLGSGVGTMRTVSKWILALGWAPPVSSSAGSSWAHQTIRVGWTIPAEESKYWMMRRPAEFPNIGKAYNI